MKYNDAESKIHKLVKKLNPDLRIRHNREFFNIKPEDAAEILKYIAELIDDAEVEYCNEKNVGDASGKNEGVDKQKQSRNYDFYGKGLRDGDEIKFTKDSSITAIVSGKGTVEFEGRKNWSLSSLVYELFKRKKKQGTNAQYRGPEYFTYNGVKLVDLPDKPRNDD